MKEKTIKCYSKTTEVLLEADGGELTCKLIFTMLQELQIASGATQTLHVFIFFNKKFCLMSSLKFTLSGVTLFLPDNLSGLKNIYIFRPEAIT